MLTAGVVVVAAVLGAQLLALGRPRVWAHAAIRRAQKAARRVGAATSAGRRVGARLSSSVTRRGSGALRVLRRRSFVAAVVAGGLLRLLWVIWATRTPPPITDPSEYLRISLELTHGISPRFGGVGGPSAYWPPGYPAALAPFVWVADRTGWLSPAFAAALLNVVAGTATIALTGRLARIWIGPGAAATAAWLVALCPALVFFTATAHADTFFIALLLAVLVLVGSPSDDVPWTHWARVGLLLGLAFLVRAPALVALCAPALAIRANGGSWRVAARSSLIVVATAAAVLTPWMVRNGVQVGVWSPGSTNNAAAVCFGHHDRAEAEWTAGLADPELRLECFGGSPYADPELLALYPTIGDPMVGEHGTEELSARLRTDEATWYRTRMTAAAKWAVTHPLEEVRLSAQKAWVMWRNEGAAVDSARNYSEHGWAGRWHVPLGVLANLWLWVVGALAAIGLVRSPACRRAAVVWVPVVLITLGVVAAFGEPHYRYPANPLLAVLAAGAVHWWRHGSAADGPGD